jgi:NADPH:quinone reductase-like Zn-dependent oxidoreductase
MKQWTLQGKAGISDLKLGEAPIPEISSNDVLVKFHADHQKETKT